MKILLVLFIICLSANLFAQDGDNYFPLSAGAKYTYTGNVKWQEVDDPKVYDSTVTWEVKTVDVFTGKDFSAAKMEGSLDDMTFYFRSTKPTDYLLIRSGNRYYKIPGEKKEIDDLFNNIKGTGKIPKGLLAGGEIILQTELKKGDYFPDISTKDSSDIAYRWVVDGIGKINITDVKGVNPVEQRTLCRLVYITNPDETSVDFVPGVGILNFKYKHNGSASSCDMKLVEFVK